MSPGRSGCAGERASVHDEQPVLCTWYSFHQDLVVDDLLEDARIAARLGIGTIIIDDGWQTTDAARGYGSCGDWQVERRKIPDPRGLVARPRRSSAFGRCGGSERPSSGYRSQAFRDGLVPLAYDEAGPRRRGARPSLAGRSASPRRAPSRPARRDRRARVQARLPRAVRSRRG